jgi:hypothetical protein
MGQFFGPAHMYGDPVETQSLDGELEERSPIPSRLGERNDQVGSSDRHGHTRDPGAGAEIVCDSSMRGDQPGTS